MYIRYTPLLLNSATALFVVASTSYSTVLSCRPLNLLSCNKRDSLFNSLRNFRLLLDTQGSRIWKNSCLKFPAMASAISLKQPESVGRQSPSHQRKGSAGNLNLLRVLVHPCFLCDPPVFRFPVPVSHTFLLTSSCGNLESSQKTWLVMCRLALCWHCSMGGDTRKAV